jgi:WD40 repeat protein
LKYTHVVRNSLVAIALLAIAACEQVEQMAGSVLPSRKAIPEVPHSGDREDAPPLEQRGNAQFSDAIYDDTGTLLLTVGSMGSARMMVWDAGNGALISAFDAVVPNPGSRTHWMIDSKRRRLLGRRGSNDAYALFDLMTGKTISVIEDTDDGAGGKTPPPPAFREPYAIGLVNDGTQVLRFRPGWIELWDVDPPRLARKVESPFTEQRFAPACVGGTPGSTYTSKIPCWELSDDRRTLAAAFTPEEPVNAYTQYMLLVTATLEIERLKIPEASIGFSFTSFAFSPDNRWLAVGNSQQLWLYDRRAREWVRSIAGEEQRSNALAPMRFTADSKRIIALGDQLQLNVFEVETGERIGRHDQPFGDFEGEIKISADGSRIVVYKFLPDIFEIFDGSTVQRLGWVCPYFCNARHNPVQPGYAVSPDGKSVAVSHRRGVAVWDTAADRIRFALADPKRKPLPYPMR